MGRIYRNGSTFAALGNDVSANFTKDRIMTRISAQVSLYPLRQSHLSAAIDDAMKAFERHDLEIQPGVMSTLLIGDQESVFCAIREALQRATERGDTTMVVTISNACPLSTRKESPQ
jgi:uncharacterized protein YqgV (UPF0045/DUF77 family)